ncbi:MAG TPA: glycosyltransferase family 4 protein [Thermoanaerobaculia bacterium]|nr:glycosyltransferase family 4 protein [Thermoanaerobaculia bacterium]
MSDPLRIAYLQEDTDLSGGVRVVMAQADALIARGHRVTLVNKGLPMSWRQSEAEWLHPGDFRDVDLTPFDFVIGTFWTTVRTAYELAGPRAIHLCQGYEGAFSFYEQQRPEIDAVYSLPVPKFVVSRHLAEICRGFTSNVTFVGQIVDDEFFREPVAREGETLRVLLAGAAQIDLKGIDDGYDAVAHARWLGASLELVRVSPWAPSAAEPLEYVQDFRVALPVHEMTRLVHSCDLFIGPNHSEEGFGLPAAEAMAAGIPTVLTRIPSYLSFHEVADYALFADEGDAEGLGEQLAVLAEESDLRAQIRQRGSAVAEQFRSGLAAERIESDLMARRDLLRSGG